MAETFWITFSIAKSGNQEERYQALLATLRKLNPDDWWDESVNFLMFTSKYNIDDIALGVMNAIDVKTDLALLSTVNGADARVVGAVEDSMLFELMPNVERFPPE